MQKVILLNKQKKTDYLEPFFKLQNLIYTY